MARIAFFPTPYPNELWYSVLCRYHLRSGNQSPNMTMEQLFGAEAVKVSTYFTGNHLQKLLSGLPYGFIDIDKVINEHTLFPFVTRFSSVQQRQAVYDYLSSGVDGNKLSSTLRLWPYANCKVPLRYCPLCNAESERRYGECYWHTHHQIRTMPLCPVHKCRLVNSNALVRSSGRAFAPASRYSCPQTELDFSCLPYEQLLTDTLYSYYSHPVCLDGNPSFRRFAYNKLVSDELLPRSSSKIIPAKLREYIIDMVGSDVFDAHFIDKNFRNTIYLMLQNDSFTIPNHYALLSTIMNLPPDAFLHDISDDNTLREHLMEMATSPYVLSKAYVANAMGLSKSNQLDTLARKLGIEPFWEQLKTHGKGDESIMKRDYVAIKALLTKEEKAMITARIAELGVASYSEYIRYCIKLELDAVGLELPKRTRNDILPGPKAKQEKKPARSKVAKPDNWNSIMELLRQGSISTGEAMRQSGLCSTRFYAFLRAESDADAIVSAGRKAKRIPYPDDWEEIVQDYESGRISWSEAIRRSGFSAGTFYNRMKERQMKI